MIITRTLVKTVVLHALPVHIGAMQMVESIGLYGKYFYYQIYQ